MSYAFVGPRVPLSVQRRWLEPVERLVVSADTTIGADYLNKTLVLELDAAWDIALPAPTSTWALTLHIPADDSFNATITGSGAASDPVLIPGTTYTFICDGTTIHNL